MGTIASIRASLQRNTVHPHGRGDNSAADQFVNVFYGSPPRAWGQSFGIVDPLNIERFTPTGVGTMLSSAAQTLATAVHPHGRGDNYDVPLREIDTFGSPPRAWGQSLGIVDPPAVIRFTPTGVGTIDSQRWGR